MSDLADHLAWMAWTWQTMVFFGCIAAALAGLTLLAVYRPETPRPGILRFATTRGDRFFVSLILAAFIFLLAIKLGIENPLYPGVVALLATAVLFRFA